MRNCGCRGRGAVIAMILLASAWGCEGKRPATVGPDATLSPDAAMDISFSPKSVLVTKKDPVPAGPKSVVRTASPPKPEVQVPFCERSHRVKTPEDLKTLGKCSKIGDLHIVGSSLTRVALPDLVSIAGDLVVDGNPELISVSFGTLRSLKKDVIIGENPRLKWSQPAEWAVAGDVLVLPVAKGALRCLDGAQPVSAPRTSGVEIACRLADGSGKVGMYHGPMIERWADGRLRRIGTLIRGKFEGLRLEWAANGRKTLRGRYVNGLEDGLWKEWSDLGEIRVEGVYSEGQKEGAWKEAHGEGHEENHYTSGRRDGVYQAWYANGVKHRQGGYKGGKKEGMWIEWNTNGTKNTEGAYAAGRREGVWTYWHTNGKKSAEGSHKNGFRSGKWTRWYTTGKVQGEAEYVAGERKVKWTFWSLSGKKESEGTLHMGRKKVGVWTYYAQDGTVSTKDHGKVGDR